MTKHFPSTAMIQTNYVLNYRFAMLNIHCIYIHGKACMALQYTFSEHHLLLWAHSVDSSTYVGNASHFFAGVVKCTTGNMEDMEVLLQKLCTLDDLLLRICC